MRPAGLLLPLLLVGCVSSSDMDRLHREVNDLHAEVLKLRGETATKTDLKQAGLGLEKETQRIVRTNADLVLKVNEFATEIEALQGQLKDTNGRLAQLSQQISNNQRALEQLRGAMIAPALPAPLVSPTVPGSPAPAPPIPQATAPPPAPVDLYAEAYGDYMQARYEMAIEGFKDFLKESGGSDRAPEALYYLAESHFNLTMYKEAAGAYEQLLTRFPGSAKGAAARLKKGLAHFELGDRAKGIVELQYCMYEYPASEEAQMAKEKLAALGISAR